MNRKICLFEDFLPCALLPGTVLLCFHNLEQICAPCNSLQLKARRPPAIRFREPVKRRSAIQLRLLWLFLRAQQIKRCDNCITSLLDRMTSWQRFQHLPCYISTTVKKIFSFADKKHFAIQSALTYTLRTISKRFERKSKRCCEYARFSHRDNAHKKSCPRWNWLEWMCIGIPADDCHK